MKISEITPRQGNIDIELDIIEKGDEREFAKFGKSGKVCTSVGKDEAGETIKVSLWNEQVDQVSQGDRIIIKNGYCGEWQGEKQLSTGRMGTLEVKKGEGAAAPAEAEAPAEPAPEETSDVDEEEVI